MTQKFKSYQENDTSEYLYALTAQRHKGICKMVCCIMCILSECAKMCKNGWEISSRLIIDLPKAVMSKKFSKFSKYSVYNTWSGHHMRLKQSKIDESTDED